MTGLQDVQQQVADVGRKAAAVQQRMEHIRPKATSPDGAATVRVTANGTLEGITFGSAARSMELDALGAVIMRTAAEAHRLAAVQMQDALADLTGANSTAVREMGQYIPPQADEFAGNPADPAAVRPDPVDDADDGFVGRGRA